MFDSINEIEDASGRFFFFPPFNFLSILGYDSTQISVISKCYMFHFKNWICIAESLRGHTVFTFNAFRTEIINIRSGDGMNDRNIRHFGSISIFDLYDERFNLRYQWFFSYGEETWILRLFISAVWLEINVPYANHDCSQ